MATEADDLQALLAGVEVRDAHWRIGNYEIIEEIGRGGMGVIYRARQEHSRRVVALKCVLSYHADSRETVARFRREAEAASSLDHPHILPIYEVGESDEGMPFFSMKYAPGGSLLQARPRLLGHTGECVRLVTKVARAVQHAHERGIIHRDLKPGNILLDGRGEPLVSDFGLAKWLDANSDLTRTLTVFGTPGYIAPEQSHGASGQLQPAADIYSLGAILFELLSGRPPFLGEHALDVIRQAADNAAPRLRSLVPSLDRDLETICARCLEREPSARYRTAADLAEDLDRWLDRRPIIARPVAPPERLWRWSRRNPLLASSIVGALAMSALASSIKLQSNHLAGVVRNDALAQRSIAVLPFEDLDRVSTNTDAARQLTLAFRNALRRKDDLLLKEAAASTSLADLWRPEDWRHAGEMLDARTLLAGSVRARMGRAHVVIRLVEAGTGTVLKRWVQDGDSAEGIAVTLSRDVASLVQKNAANTPEAPAVPETLGETSDQLARDYLSSARELYSRYNIPDLDRAIALFQKAVERDPNYALGHAFLGSAYAARGELDPAGHWLERATAAANTAVRLAPMLPEAHRAHGAIIWHQGKLAECVDSMLSAYELDPSSFRSAQTVGNIFELLGQPDLSLCWLGKAVRREARPGLTAERIADALLDLTGDAEAAEEYHRAETFQPDLPGGALGIARLSMFHREFQQAREKCAATRLRFTDNPQPLLMAAEVEFFARNFPEADRMFEQLCQMDHAGDPDFCGSIRYLSALGLIRMVGGKPAAGKALIEEARQLDLKDLQQAPNNSRRLYSLAAESASLNDQALALSAFRKALDAGWIDYRSYELDPRFDTIRDTAEAREILRLAVGKVTAMRQERPGNL